MNDPYLDLSRSHLMVQLTPNIWFSISINSNVWPNSAHVLFYSSLICSVKHTLPPGRFVFRFFLSLFETQMVPTPGPEGMLLQKTDTRQKMHLRRDFLNQSILRKCKLNLSVYTPECSWNPTDGIFTERSPLFGYLGFHRCWTVHPALIRQQSLEQSPSQPVDGFEANKANAETDDRCVQAPRQNMEEDPW